VIDLIEILLLAHFPKNITKVITNDHSAPETRRYTSVGNQNDKQRMYILFAQK